MSDTNTQSIFLLSTRKKLRFKGNKGEYSTEDLWDLSLKDLDAMAVSISESIDNSSKRSFLENPDPKARAAFSEAKLKLDVIVAVINIRQEENKQKAADAERRQRLSTLEEALAEKKVESLKGMSPEDLEKEIAALKAG